MVETVRVRVFWVSSRVRVFWVSSRVRVFWVSSRVRVWGNTLKVLKRVPGLFDRRQ